MSEPKAYTTAIIAAVPAQDDPVHEVVAEDAHVTLQFLGEAADLSEDQVSQIEQSLEMLASVVYPFQADISGTAELGPDKAQVLIVQSALLTKIRETLGMAEAVSTAVASVEQFPNWIPHLTLAYEGEMPDVSAYKSVTIGSLELWLAEEHRVYNLVQAKEAVTAAGYKVFEEGLHPRGADGRFIEKFGVIKFLTGMGWQYGKVEGIYADPGSGATTLTVTPSDLSGKTHGESVMLSPKQVYRAPKAKIHLPISSVGVQKVGGQAGSNQGGLYNIPKPGTTEDEYLSGAVEQFYVKKPKTKSHGNNEALANALYEEAGVPVPEVDLHPNDGQLYSKIVKGKQDMAAQLNNDEWTDQVRRNFAVDAWLGNRDVFGMSYDNILTDENGVPWRIDNGGALLYRAMGEKKTDFGGKVTELDSFRQGKKAKIFGPGMSKVQELDGAERVLAISPGQIDDLVAEYSLPKSLADTLKARRVYIASYYGLTLPESKTPAETEGPTSAPLVDAPDIAANAGKTRNWFKTKLSHLGFFGQSGDNIELPDGKRVILGKNDDDGSPLSIVGMQAQVLGWTSQYQPDAEIFLRKFMAGPKDRPEHGSKLLGSDLTAQNWKRGDHLIDSDGVPWKVTAWNSDTGAVLLEFGDKPPVMLDTFGKDKAGIYTVQRWDPPAVDTAEPTPIPDVVPIQTEQQAIDIAAEPFEVQPITPGKLDEPIALPPEEFEYVPPQAGKTGQAAVAEAQIKADLATPLPSGNGTPAPAKTSAPGGAKTMVIGDGTEAATGDAVISKKDGKTYTFVKPKGQYAVVTDPNGEDPDKQLLKLASTMTQPGKLPAGDLDVELPKTATGEVPALGMMAVAKDGWAGEITLISPDGKFVFITDANGKRKRKSTGTVSITSAPQGVPEAPKKAPGPVKDYSSAPLGPWMGEEKITGWLLSDNQQMHAGLMVHVWYADGSDGLEPYSGQPLEAMETNSQGKVAVFGDLPGYLGPVSSSQLVSAAQANGKATTYQVIYAGNVFFTDGTTGPSGGLVLWYDSDDDPNAPGTDAWEAHSDSPIVLTVIGSENATSAPLTLPEGTAFQTADEYSASTLPAGPPLYDNEAKTLAQWKGQLALGQEISLDGDNWLTVLDVSPGGSVKAETGNGSAVYLGPYSAATYVVKAPPMVDGNAPDPAMQPTPEMPGEDVLPVSTGKKKIGDLVQGDVVTDGEGQTTIIDSVTDPNDGTQQVYVKVMGADWTEPADPSFEFTHHGNLTENPVEIPAGLIAPHLYPGATLQFNSADVPAQVVSYPEHQGSGSYKVAVMQDGDPDNLAIVTIGEWNAGVDISNEAVLMASLGSFTSAQSAGVDTAKLNALFDTAKVEKQDTVDHHAQMTDQGIPFGTAQHPIFFDPGGGAYYRQGPTGLENWNADSGIWETYSATAVAFGLEKVWDGVPFEGKLTVPEGFPTMLMANSSDNLLDYKPKPGETIQVAKVQMGSAGEQSVLISYPSGLNGPAHTVIVPMGETEPKMSSEPFTEGWKDSGVFTEFTTIHDPFAGPEPAPPITHQGGGQPPAELGTYFQQVGYTPQPGDQFFVGSYPEWPAKPYKAVANGKYALVKKDGTLGNANWDLSELREAYAPGTDTADYSYYTWTYLPTGADAPATVAGLPEGFAPYVPGEGQSLLKVTLSNGKENIYLQKQPGAGWYEMSPDGTVNESSDAVKSNFVVQQKLAGKGSQAAKYDLLHPLPEGTKKVHDPVPTFANAGGSFTPEPHQKVVSLQSFAGDPDPWFYVQNAPGEEWQPAPGIPGDTTGVSDHSMQGLTTPSTSSGSIWTLVYDGPSGQAAVDTPEKALPTFSGYTPKEGEKVFEEPNGSHWVFTPADGKYHPVNNDGTLYLGFGVLQDVWESDSDTKVLPQVWPATSPNAPEAAPEAPTGAPTQGGVFGGYQTDPADSVIEFIPPGGNVQTLVKKAGTGTWNVVLPDGTLGNPDDGEAFSQDTIEWAASGDTTSYGVTELQGAIKGAPVTEHEPLPTSGPAYAGVAGPTPLLKGGYNFGTYTPSSAQQTKLDELLSLDTGQSIYVLEDSSLPGGSTAVLVRNSDGSWASLGTGGYQISLFDDDEDLESYVISNNYTLHKAHFGAPTQAPAPAVNTYAGPVITGWQDKGVPDPGSMGYVGNPEDTVGLKSGTWLFTQTTASLANESGTGLYVKLAEDVAGSGDTVQVSHYAVVSQGVVKEIKTPTSGKATIGFNLGGVQHIYAQNFTGTQATPTVQAPVAAPSAPSAPPAYPGAQKPSQEDINAWGGELTKDGHIPAPGMFVTGKGPMSGKIVSVSKDKSKATVLTGDGKKTTRLISALKTDPSANYSAYAAPVTMKDIPQGMPLAVDTVAEALTKTAQDGKFRAILNGHPGVSGGQMVVTKTTAPSGKVFNRVHLTLTPAQREQLVSMLAGTGEKGDWVKTSKSSDAVAVGDQLPMRKSSTNNPDGTPRWKVDPETKPPTHAVTKVEEDPSGSGVKIVTMKNINTGEEITSRIHPGKTLSYYTWDPDKPKTLTAGALNLSDTAKAQGWQKATDGGISAIKGGADNGKLYNEPGTAVSKSALGQLTSSWETLRNVSADGVVIELVDPKGSSNKSSTGVTVVSVPEGVGEQALGAALAKMGIDYRPMTQDDAKTAVRGVLRTMISLDTSDVDTPKHFTDEKLFAEAGKVMGISDLGWQDVLIGVDESIGKTSFFWSDRARNALAGKASYNLIYRAADNASAAQIVANVKYGSASAMMKKTTGMLDGSGSVGNGNGANTDNGNHAGHGSYSSAQNVTGKLPSKNSFATYKAGNMMVYHRAEAVLGRIMDYRLASNDAFGLGQGQGANHLKAATSMSSVRDYFMGGGLPTEAIGFIAVQSASEREAAIKQLKADGFTHINGRPVEDIVITKAKAATLTVNDLPPVTNPANARPILDLPVSYDAPAPAAGATTGGEAAA